MSDINFDITDFARLIPDSLLNLSGKVFYSGRNAFSMPSPIYVLGLNPGGDPEEYENETLLNHTRAVLTTHANNWSAYRDESWKGSLAGTHGMAPRVLHLFSKLGLEPGSVPSSNLIFVRSAQERHLKNTIELAECCWPFHARVIQLLKPKTIVCFGRTTSRFVRKKLEASQIVGEFIEKNDRRWRNQIFQNVDGLKVAMATHPSRANWCSPASDPSDFFKSAIGA